MLRRFIISLPAALIFLFSISSQPSAQDGGFYIGLQGTYNFPEVLSQTLNIGTTDVELSDGYVASAAFGYEFGDGLRVEAQFSYSPNDVAMLGSSVPISGGVDIMTLMANVAYDFGIQDWPVHPYIGAGVGVMRLEADNLSPFGATTIDDIDLSMAIQAFAGISIELMDQVALTLDYRHLRAPDLALTTAAGLEEFGDYATNQVMLGVRIRFFESGRRSRSSRRKPAEREAPPPTEEPKTLTPEKPVEPEPPVAAPPPEPAPPPMVAAVAVGDARVFTLYFKSNSSYMGRDGTRVVGKAAAAARDVGSVRIVLVGHTDSTGSAKYNKWLAKRRVNRVKSALARLGVARDTMETRSAGESSPLVDTGDGVDERRNRRVEIRIR